MMAKGKPSLHSWQQLANDTRVSVLADLRQHGVSDSVAVTRLI
jgi:hypothetical protein